MRESERKANPVALDSERSDMLLGDVAFGFFDLRGCSDCILCVGLRNKKYCIRNQQYTKEEYEEFCREYNEFLDQQEQGYRPEAEYA